MKVSKYFEDHEVLPPESIKAGKTVAELINPKLLVVIDAIREKFGPTVINGTLNGYTYRNSGYRSPACKEGAPKSQHRVGNAADCKFTQHTVQQVYAEILKNEKYWLDLGLTTLENINATPSWLHVCVAPTKMNKIRIINP
jgi:hypothetical protein